MLNKTGDVIYVGKAKNLAKRIASYFSGKKDLKTAQLVANIHDINVTVTRSEEEAFLLELELIKKLQPKYNIIFKDAKSYPFIKISKNHNYPQLTFYRGNTDTSADYYGPYPGVSAARAGLELLQMIFKLRQCDDVFFKNRSRPCLQYQIKRCSAPCVGLISKEDYQVDVKNTKDFLQGKTNEIVDGLVAEMELAAKQLLYERAAQIREQIKALRKIQKHQIIIDANTNVNVDVLGISCEENAACIHLLCIRGGRILGSRQYFPKHLISTADNTEAAVLEAFILQHYSSTMQNNQDLTEIVVANLPENNDILQTTINKLAAQKIVITSSCNGARAEWLKMAEESAKQALASQQEKSNNLQNQFDCLSTTLNSQVPIKRIECFDVSHTQGEACIGSCVVYSKEGPVKQDYRRYNITGITKGDDYAGLAQTLERHYIKMIALNNLLPELVIIDGGKGQLKIAEQIIKDKFKLSSIILLAVAKGKTRKIGYETLYLLNNGEILELNVGSTELKLIQLIRDEAHNFAITGHRAKRAKNMLKSNLEQIPGVGAKRGLQLIKQFGGFKEVCQANIEELTKVPGISRKIAERIYNALRQDPNKSS